MCVSPVQCHRCKLFILRNGDTFHSESLYFHLHFANTSFDSLFTALNYTLRHPTLQHDRIMRWTGQKPPNQRGDKSFRHLVDTFTARDDRSSTVQKDKLPSNEICRNYNLLDRGTRLISVTLSILIYAQYMDSLSHKPYYGIQEINRRNEKRKLCLRIQPNVYLQFQFQLPLQYTSFLMREYHSRK